MRILSEKSQGRNNRGSHGVSQELDREKDRGKTGRKPEIRQVERQREARNKDWVEDKEEAREKDKE